MLGLKEKILRAERVHGQGKFDYSLWDVKSCHDKAPVHCLEHDVVWEINYSNHVHGKRGCPKCRGSKITKAKTQDFKYFKADLAVSLPNITCDEATYRTLRTECSFSCSIHGDFVKKPCDVLASKYGCTICSEEHDGISIRKLTLDESLEKLSHLTHLDFSHTEYFGYGEPIEFYCTTHKKKHKAKIGNLLRGHGCDLCGKDSGASKQVGFINDTTIQRDPYKFIQRSTSLYFVELEDEGQELLKVGISSQILSRFSKIKEDFVNPRLSYVFSFNSYVAFYLEQYIHELLKEFQFIPLTKESPRGDRKRGWTELFLRRDITITPIINALIKAEKHYSSLTDSKYDNDEFLLGVINSIDKEMSLWLTS